MKELRAPARGISTVHVHGGSENELFIFFRNFRTFLSNIPRPEYTTKGGNGLILYYRPENMEQIGFKALYVRYETFSEGLVEQPLPRFFTHLVEKSEKLA